MDIEKDNYRDLRGLYDNCKKYMYYGATLIMTDGSTFDGIIENVDGDNVWVLIGEDVIDKENEGNSNQQRQYGRYGYNPRFRRYRRRNFPLSALAEVALLPYIAPPVPYPYYPYPYYPY